jgi:PAS domain S-box-containing protein
VEEAADFLSMPVAAVEALAARGYLQPVEAGPDGPRFAASDLKGFMARNEPDEDLFAEEVGADPQALLDALDGQSDEMARRAFDIFRATFPEAAEWPLDEQARFVDQARKRFEAILAVTGQGEDVDEALVADLEAVGAGAAWSGSPLPQLLIVLRISRDLVVQTAVEIAEERGRHWGLALSLLLTRVLPSIDRLTDALARGYWAAVLGREEELRERMESLVEHSSDGVYEVDLDGRVTYANPQFAVIVGRSPDQIEGLPLSEVLLAPPGRVEALMSEPRGSADGETRVVDLEIARTDGIGRRLVVTTFPRRSEGVVVGFQGIVRDVTAERELERAKNDFLALITHGLRSPLASILGHGVTLQSYAEELSEARLRQIGRSVHRQAERMSRLADDLYDVSQLENQSLSLNLRVVEIVDAIENAVASVPDPFRVEIEVPEGIEVVADLRRLEQVVANLVENGLRHGEPPVHVVVTTEASEVRIDVSDRGRGVPDAVVPTLFSSLHTVSRHDRDRDAGTGLGLFLVKGLVEGMGGRVAYARAPSGGATFSVWLPGGPSAA